MVDVDLFLGEGHCFHHLLVPDLVIVCDYAHSQGSFSRVYWDVGLVQSAPLYLEFVVLEL